MSTKEQFKTALNARIIERYGHDWAGDPERRRRFVESTLAGTAVLGKCAKLAWRDIGMPGRISLKAVKALPGTEGAQ